MQLELKVVIERPSIFGDFEIGDDLKNTCKNRAAYPQNRKSGDFDHFVITFFPLCDF